MTADEKALVERLEVETLMCSGVMVRRIPSQDDLDAAALIRRQSEEIDMLARALVVASENSLYILKILNYHHAAALAIAKERA